MKPEDIEAIAARTAELVLASDIGKDGTTLEQVLNRLKTWLGRQK